MKQKIAIHRKGLLIGAISFLLGAALVVMLRHFLTPPLYDGKPGFKAGQRCINPRDHAVMVWVPAGEFHMGSGNDDKDAFADEKPQHRVYLDGYWIYKHDVTVADYKAFCISTSRAMPEAPPWGWIDSHPMVNVTWEDACAYALWAGAKLPTEAQWEKAARGADGQKYPWGNNWEAQYCRHGSRDTNRTAPVGSYTQDISPYGCMDMGGNVMQWCHDWFNDSYYKVTPLRNPTGPNSGKRHALKGGSWDDVSPGIDFRCANRSFDDSDPSSEKSEIIGFRCVILPGR